MYIIKNKTYNTYFKKHMLGIKHFVTYKGDARRFKDKEEAKLTMNLFNHKKNFKIIEVVK